MDDEPVKFTRNKRLIDNDDGSHVGGGLNNQIKDPIDEVKLNKRGLSIFD